MQLSIAGAGAVPQCSPGGRSQSHRPGCSGSTKHRGTCQTLTTVIHCTAGPAAAHYEQSTHTASLCAPRSPEMPAMIQDLPAESGTPHAANSPAGLQCWPHLPSRCAGTSAPGSHRGRPAPARATTLLRATLACTHGMDGWQLVSPLNAAAARAPAPADPATVNKYLASSKPGTTLQLQSHL